MVGSGIDRKGEAGSCVSECWSWSDREREKGKKAQPQEKEMCGPPRVFSQQEERWDGRQASFPFSLPRQWRVFSKRSIGKRREPGISTEPIPWME